MDTVDAVARALANAIWGGSPLVEDAFESLSDGEQDTYRSWAARAAIDALGLTTQEQLLRNGHTVCSRLVSGWVRKDNTNE
ncbi:hypothetical protein [Mycobacterium sp. 23]|uniref:hypothetical protein n=1 Tax=Mycobacterium sp. 23 TaxID=3400424 RepID=UPI003AACE7F9